jgi:hypothetical protein
MRVIAETSPTFHLIVIQNTQRAELYPFGIIITRETECLVAFQPAVIYKTSGIRLVKDCVHAINLLKGK